MLESGLTVAQFFSTNHNSLLHIATNEIALFCLDHRSHQLAFFVQRRGKGGAKGLLTRCGQITLARVGITMALRRQNHSLALTCMHLQFKLKTTANRLVAQAVMNLLQCSSDEGRHKPLKF